MNDLKNRMVEEYKKGNIIVAGVDGLHVYSLKGFVEQPADGILYDLNRDDLTVLNFSSDPKWINDYAVGRVIIELKNRIKELENHESKT